MSWAVGLLFVFSLAVVSASHYRYATLKWQVTTGNTVNFTLESAWRRSYYNPPPVVGSNFQVDGDFYFGDGPKYNFKQVVTTISLLEDWFISSTNFMHTYATANDTKNGGIPWNFRWTGNARIGNLNNNANAAWNLMATVDCNEGSSPISKMLPIANIVSAQNPVSSFVIPAVVNTDDQLHFALGTSLQMCGASGCIQPPGLSVDPASGVVTWNVSSAKPGLWCTVITISTPRVYVSVDFIINVTQVQGKCAAGCTNQGKNCLIPSNCGTCSTSNNCVKPLPPFFIAPTPPANQTFAVVLGQQVSFTLKAMSPQNTSSVQIQTSSFPDGATIGNNVGSNPVTRLFSWTPASYQLGRTIVCFSAIDGQGYASLQYCITVDVSVGCNPACNQNAFCNAGVCTCVEGYTGPNCDTFGGLVPNGVPLYGNVAMHQYNYYYVDTVDSGQAIKMLVQTNDPNQETSLFVSTKVNQPTITNKQWDDVGNNTNYLTILPSDSNYIVGRYYIGVEGWYGALRTIDYNITVFIS